MRSKKKDIDGQKAMATVEEFDYCLKEITACLLKIRQKFETGKIHEIRNHEAEFMDTILAATLSLLREYEKSQTLDSIPDDFNYADTNRQLN